MRVNTMRRARVNGRKRAKKISNSRRAMRTRHMHMGGGIITTKRKQD